MIRDGSLLAVRRDGVLRVPAELVANDTVLKHLPGVLTLLRDAGYNDEEALRWLYTADDTLPGTPRGGARRRPGPRGQAAGAGAGLLTRCAHLTYLAVLAGCLAVRAVAGTGAAGRRAAAVAAAAAHAAAGGRSCSSLWDLAAIAAGHWTFDPAQTTGVLLPGGLPLDELLFFVVVPVCAILGFEAVRAVLRWPAGRRHDLHRRGAARRRRRGAGRPVRAAHPAGDPGASSGRRTRSSWSSSCSSNGVLTGRGIVRYDPDAIIGLRIVYAPVEDLLFGFALVLLTLSMWVWLGRRACSGRRGRSTDQHSAATTRATSSSAPGPLGQHGEPEPVGQRPGTRATTATAAATAGACAGR